MPSADQMDRGQIEGEVRGGEEKEVVFPTLGKESSSMDNIKVKEGEGMEEQSVKGTLKRNRSKIRDSFRKLGAKLPFSPTSPGTKNMPDKDSDGHYGVEQEKAPSPSMSLGSPVCYKDGDGANDLLKTPGLLKSFTEKVPTPTDLENFVRRSLRPKKTKEILPNPIINETISEEKLDVLEQEQIQEEEDYKLPPIPPLPLSVMQIHKLIEEDLLQEAHLNLLALRQELRTEMDEKELQTSVIEMAKKEKDLSLLYSALREKMNMAVREWGEPPSPNRPLLLQVARITQEEEQRAGDPGMVPYNWRDGWRMAVQEGVRSRVEVVPLDNREETSSWLAVHLGRLGQAVVRDLEHVKKELKYCYPPSFDVFNTYVDAYNQAVAQHLQKIHTEKLETKDGYALLNWIINDYKSEKVLGTPTLQPEFNMDNMYLPLKDEFLNKIKAGFCEQIKQSLRNSLQNLVNIECSDMWSVRNKPQMEEDFYHSEIHIDIWTAIKGFLVHSKNIGSDLEKQVLCVSAQELKPFLQCFESEFIRWSTDLPDVTLKAEYQVAYINSFTALKKYLDGYEESSTQQVNQTGKEIDGLIQRLSQSLMDHFKTELQPFLRRMMTRKWLSTEEDFQQIVKRTEDLAKLCKGMKPPQVQIMVNEAHYYIAKEYISRLMKNNYSCKHGKHERAAVKLIKQWAELQELFKEMNSTSEWLYPVGEHLSKIIGMKNMRDIKNNLQPLVKDYPDISHKHLAAVLYYRGMVRGRERQLILRKLAEVKTTTGTTEDKRRAFFSNIQPAINTDCLSSGPLSCLSVLLPDT